MTVITVRFDGRSLPLEDAYAKATQISNTVNAYRQRADQATRNLKFLHDQETRLAELLTKLETERAELQSKLWLLNGEIEMISRNEKLIDMTQARQNAIEKYERYDAVSLDQVTGRINKIRSEQEARLQALSNHDGQTDYEDRARTMLESEATARTIFEKSKVDPVTTPTAIEIGPEDVQQKPSEADAAAVASR
jgi:chromosome segregation ATPase